MQCATYPFWSPALTSEIDWRAEATQCEGISLTGRNTPNVATHSSEQNVQADECIRSYAVSTSDALTFTEQAHPRPKLRMQPLSLPLFHLPHAGDVQAAEHVTQEQVGC